MLSKSPPPRYGHHPPLRCRVQKKVLDIAFIRKRLTADPPGRRAAVREPPEIPSVRQPFPIKPGRLRGVSDESFGVVDEQGLRTVLRREA